MSQKASKSPSRIVPKLAKWLLPPLAIGALAWLWVGTNRLLAVDSLKPFRSATNDTTDNGVEMTNFDWKAYNGAKLVAQAHVARAYSGRDSEQVELTQVSNGRYFDADKELFKFETQSAVYFSQNESLEGTGGIHVLNDRMNLRSAEFQYIAEEKKLVVPRPLAGQLEGGDLKAEKMTYEVESKTFLLSGVRWSGLVSQDSKKTKWSFSPQDDKTPVDVKSRGSITTYTKFKATDGEVVILADGGEFNKDTDVLVAKGNVKYFGSDANITCNLATVYRKERRVVLVGAVDMLLKPKQGEKPVEVIIPPVEPVVPEKIKAERPAPVAQSSDNKEQQDRVRSGKNIHDYPITVTSERIEYWYGKGQKRATINGKPQARQEFPDGTWRMVWAESAYYDGEKETLNLKNGTSQPTVRMLNSLGDDMRATSVLVSTKEGDDMMDATGVSMEITIDDDELPDKTKKSGDGGTDPPPPIKGDIKKKGA